MNCIICNSKTNHFLTKDFEGTTYGFLMSEIKKLEYEKCINCGFTISKTHCEMDSLVWDNLNKDFHHYLENNSTETNQPPYLEQAELINILEKNSLINMDDAIDYAGGYGTLSNVLKKYFGYSISIYEQYVLNNEQTNYIKKENLGKHKTVFNSALIEHIFDREELDHINSIVDNDGCLILHSVICENIPKDPNWFYMNLPVHCSFHTNKSMEILMTQWGYKSSIYCPKAKSWVLFKIDSPNIQNVVNLINKEMQVEYLIYKKGFVDYWKLY